MPDAGEDRVLTRIRRYDAEAEAFNSTEHKTDEESDAHADSTYNRTCSEFVGVPAMTAASAIAALDFVIREELPMLGRYECDFEDTRCATICDRPRPDPAP
jgi:hypothetical protein